MAPPMVHPKVKPGPRAKLPPTFVILPKRPGKVNLDPGPRAKGTLEI